MASTKLIAFCRVEASRDCISQFNTLLSHGWLCQDKLTYNKIRPELVGYRHGNLLKGSNVVRVAHSAGRPGDIDTSGHHFSATA